MVAAVLASLVLLMPTDGRAPVVGGLEALPAAEWSLAHVRHLVDRVGFGATPRQLEELRALGPEGAVDALLSGLTNGQAPASYDLEKVGKKFRENAMSAMADGEPRTEEEIAALKKQLVKEDREQFVDYRGFWFEQMVTTSDPVREKLALFWHGYFTSAQREVKNSYLMAHQIELYRSSGALSFRDLLHRASKEPAMIEYLNNDQNKKQAPNENFAREVMELFTMGPGNYSERDIKEAARAFTGWQQKAGEFVFARGRHDFGEKEFLGRKGRFEGDQILDILLEQEATPRFVAKKLFEFYVHPDPSPQLVDELAKRLRSLDYATLPFLRTLFLSREFYSQDAQGALFKSPVEFVVSTLRRLEIDPPSGKFLAEASTLLGQELLNPPNVKGWEGGESWISASTLLQRANVARILVFGERAFDREELKKRRGSLKQGGGKALAQFQALRELKGWRPELKLGERVGDCDTATEAVIRISDRLLPVAPSKETIQELAQYAAPFGDDAFDARQPETQALLEDVVHLVLCLPEYQLN